MIMVEEKIMKQCCRSCKGFIEGKGYQQWDHFCDITRRYLPAMHKGVDEYVCMFYERKEGAEMILPDKPNNINPITRLEEGSGVKREVWCWEMSEMCEHEATVHLYDGFYVCVGCGCLLYEDEVVAE